MNILKKTLIESLLWALGISLLFFSLLGAIFGINIFLFLATIGIFIISTLIAYKIIKL